MSYNDALTRGTKVGAANADDAAVMAMWCATSLQQMAGAVSPALVWEGAQHRGMTAAALAELAVTNAEAVADLMWVAPDNTEELADA